ncbi:hypothetical protein HYFRA_00010814 [Hymenoscyphus fraxineus]|uniref:Uncharacterized protein n=1 Tax=Hymenoscyphus fraxineus TaxID=746836 RepID=A0A9N9L3A7_9HELO|nr:hypothetical protein HYFRA_00010814 [Hymenoscyphus fraxineus]
MKFTIVKRCFKLFNAYQEHPIGDFVENSFVFTGQRVEPTVLLLNNCVIEFQEKDTDSFT